MSGHIVQQMCRGIDQSRAVIVFVTRRYMAKVDADVDDNCKKEFNYAVMRRGTALMVPVVMERATLDTRQWFGPLGMELRSNLYVSMIDDQQMTGSGLEGVLQKLAAIGIYANPGQSVPSSVAPAASSVPPREVAFRDSDSDEIAFIITPEGIGKYVNKAYNKKITALAYRCSDGDLRDQDGWGGAIGHADRDRVLTALKQMCKSQGVGLRIHEAAAGADRASVARPDPPREVSFKDSDGDEVAFLATPEGVAKFVNKRYNKNIISLVYRSDGDLRDQDGWGGAVAAQDRQRVVNGLGRLCKQHGVTFTVL